MVATVNQDNLFQDALDSNYGADGIGRDAGHLITNPPLMAAFASLGGQGGDSPQATTDGGNFLAPFEKMIRDLVAADPKFFVKLDETLTAAGPQQTADLLTRASDFMKEHGKTLAALTGQGDSESGTPSGAIDAKQTAGLVDGLHARVTKDPGYVDKLTKYLSNPELGELMTTLEGKPELLAGIAQLIPNSAEGAAAGQAGADPLAVVDGIMAQGPEFLSNLNTIAKADGATELLTQLANNDNITGMFTRLGMPDAGAARGAAGSAGLGITAGATSFLAGQIERDPQFLSKAKDAVGGLSTMASVMQSFVGNFQNNDVDFNLNNLSNLGESFQDLFGTMMTGLCQVVSAFEPDVGQQLAGLFEKFGMATQNPELAASSQPDRSLSAQLAGQPADMTYGANGSPSATSAPANDPLRQQGTRAPDPTMTPTAPV